MKKLKFTKRIISLLLATIMIFGMSTTVFAYSSSCTIGTVAPGTTKQGHITLSPYVGLGKNIYAELVGGKIEYGENITILIVRESNNKTLTQFNLNYANNAYSYGITLPASGDYRVTIQNNTSVNATVLVGWK